MGKLAIKGLYGNLTFKEQKNLMFESSVISYGVKTVGSSGIESQDFERKFGAKGFMESDF